VNKNNNGLVVSPFAAVSTRIDRIVRGAGAEHERIGELPGEGCSQ
jgi:hypothetical protein